MSSKKREEKKTKTTKKQKLMSYFIISKSMKTGNGRKPRQKVMIDGGNKIDKSGKGCWEGKKNIIMLIISPF